MAISPTHEIMISAIAELVIDDRHVAVGAASPIPAAGVMLARHLNGGRTRLSLLGSRSQNPFTDGGRELFDCAAQGRIDTFFLSGAQIDGQGNVNLLGTGGVLGKGGSANIERRYSGNFGAPFMIYTVPKVILFRIPHTTTSLVDKVDFISAAGQSPDNVWRRGGPKHLITDRCMFDFDGKGFHLRWLHPGHDQADIAANTGFGYQTSDTVQETPPIDETRRRLIQGEILEGLRETYPSFVAAAA